MFRAALRPLALATRTAARPALATRAIATTSVRLSGHAAPPVFGEGAKAGEVPTDENQSTGLERIQILGEIEGVEVFDNKPLDSSRVGTLADPIKVLSYEHERIVGCTGAPAESHELLWFNLTDKKVRRCPECGSVYHLDYQGPAEGEAHAHH